MADTTIKKWNDTTNQWEELYPETTVSQLIATGDRDSTTFLRGDGVFSDTLTGNLTIEDSALRVGDVSADNYLQIQQVGNALGFTFQHSNASAIQNLQGSTNQALVLGDVDNNNAGTLLGASILQSGSWTKKFNLTGEGELYIGSTATDQVWHNGNFEPIVDNLDILPGYSNSNEDTVSYNTTERAIELQSNSDNSMGLVYPALKTESGVSWKISFSIKASASATSGVYFRIQEYDSALPDGKTHISHDASHSEVQEDTRQRMGFLENQAIGTSWEQHSFFYTPTSTAVWFSPNFLNWSGLGTNALYVKNFRIFAIQEDSTDANTLDGLDSTQFLRSDQNDTMNGDLTISSAYPRIFLADSNNNSDYSLLNANGSFKIYDDTNSATRLELNANGHTDLYGNLHIESAYPRIYLTDTDSDSDYSVLNGNGYFSVYDDTNGAFRLKIDSGGTTYFYNDIAIGNNTLDFNANSGNSTTAQIKGDRSATDLDTRNFTTEGGFSYTTFDGSTSNKPSGSYNNANGVITMNTHSGSYNWQLAFTNNQGKMFSRYRNGGSYSSWNEILTSATSVNADTLDSINSTQFLRSDTSDTMSGQLEISHNAENHLNINSSTTSGAIHFRESGTLRGIFGFTNGSAIYNGSGDNDMVWRAEANAHIVSNTSTHGLSIVSGDIGVGTTSPLTKMHIVESGTATALTVQNSSSNGTVMKLATTGDGRNLYLQSDHIYSNGALYLGDNNYDTIIRGSVVKYDTPNLYLNNNNSPTDTDTTIYFGDDQSDTAHYMQFDDSSQLFKFSNDIYALGHVYADNHVYAKGEIRINYDNTGDAILRFGDAASDTAHYLQFENSSQQYIFSDKLRLFGELELDHNGSGTVDSYSVKFVSQFNNTNVVRELKTNSSGDLLFNGNELATESYVDTAVSGAGGGVTSIKNFTNYVASAGTSARQLNITKSLSIGDKIGLVVQTGSTSNYGTRSQEIIWVEVGTSSHTVQTSYYFTSTSTARWYAFEVYISNGDLYIDDAVAWTNGSFGHSGSNSSAIYILDVLELT